MRTVAICGFGTESRKPVYSLPDTTEIWTVNHAYVHFPRIDRLLEIHTWDMMTQENYYMKATREEYFDWLAQPHDFPIFMQQARPEVPASVRYPIEEAMALKGPDFTSSFCYQMAQAVMEKVDRVEIYGYDMQMGTEYAYQRPEALSWIYFARAKGIDVYVPPNCGLFVRHRLYGYEGTQMLSRQTIDKHLHGYKEQEEQASAVLQQWAGILIERQNQGASKRKIDEAAINIRQCEAQLAMVQGAVTALNHLLDTCDLIEVEPVLTLEEVMQVEG